MNILSLSHCDLDGIGAQIVLRKQFGEITRMNTSYSNIEEYLENIEGYCYRSKPDKVFITDLSFTYNFLQRLHSIALQNPNTEFYFIDHHPFEENNGDFSNLLLNNFTIVISSKASATKLTYLFLKSKFGLNNLELFQFVEYVNAYDIWLEEEKEFRVGFVYNELFWDYKISVFWSKFKDNYKLRNNDKERYKELITKKNKLFTKLESSGRIMKFGNRILLIFIDDFQGHVTIDYPGFYSYAIIRSNGSCSVRLKSDAVADGNTKNGIIEKMINAKLTDTAGGHDGAFGINILNPTAHQMVEFSKSLVGFIDEELEKINL